MNLILSSRLTLLVFCGLASACFSCAASPEASDSSAVQEETEKDPARGSDMHLAPAATPHERQAQLRSLLTARHARDLPSLEVLQKHSEYPATLRWLARNDETLMVRSRALALLRFAPDDASKDLLLEVAGDVSQPALLRASALRGLSGVKLSTHDAVRERLESSLREDDPRISIAAVQVLASQKVGRGLLEGTVKDATVDARTRAAAKSALAGE